MDFLYNNLTEKELKDFLDQKYLQYCQTDFLPHDPLGIVHQFTKKSDQEIIGLLMATISWGNRKAILNSGAKLLEIVRHSPTDFIVNHQASDLKKINFVHRTFQRDDLLFFFSRLQSHYQNAESLESRFSTHAEIEGVKGRIINFRTWFFEQNEGFRTEKHVANPNKKSAAKRLNMYLRWMCRTNAEGVDLGIWSSIPTSELYLPLDVHTSTVARKLGILKRTQNDWATLEELMQVLQKFDPIDPCKYDFALFGLGNAKEL